VQPVVGLLGRHRLGLHRVDDVHQVEVAAQLAQQRLRPVAARLPQQPALRPLDGREQGAHALDVLRRRAEAARALQQHRGRAQHPRALERRAHPTSRAASSGTTRAAPSPARQRRLSRRYVGLLDSCVTTCQAFIVNSKRVGTSVPPAREQRVRGGS
jgi:hypothetical protein